MARSVESPRWFLFLGRFLVWGMFLFLGGGFMCIQFASVESGSLTVPRCGTMQLQSLDHGCVFQCKQALLPPDCDKKVAASNFVRKGCEVTKSEEDQVWLLRSLF